MRLSPAPAYRRSAVVNLARALFGSPERIAGSLIAGWIAWKLTSLAVDWLVFDAVVFGGPENCKPAKGACWPFIAEKVRFMAFGIYPIAEQWRVFIALVLFACTCITAMIPRCWSRWLLLSLPPVVAVIFVLLRGGVFGLALVSPNQWSGLPLTILLSVATFALALPLGIILALARCSKFRSIRTVSIAIIESIRGIPLLSLLFMASVMSPMILPEWAAHNAILIAQFPITIFISVYVAETVRSGLLAIPAAQVEAAASLGLDYWRTTLLVVLPQAMSSVVGPLVALFIAFFQDTTLVGLVGLMDFLATIRAALHDPKWQGIATVEAYLLAGLVYLACSVGLGLYGQFLERAVSRERSVARDRTAMINVI